MNLTQDEVDQLTIASTEAEWHRVCDRVKARCNGNYPDDWYVRVIMPGLPAKAAARAKTVGGR